MWNVFKNDDNSGKCRFERETFIQFLFNLLWLFFSYLNLDKPEIIKNNHGTEVNENEQVTLYRQIISNPLSNVSWYNGSDLLDTQWSVKNATFNIENATCTDTKNYTLLANNGVQENVTALVELIVNCEYDIYFQHV